MEGSEVVRVDVRVSQAELNRIKQYAQKNNMSPSQFAQNAVRVYVDNDDSGEIYHCSLLDSSGSNSETPVDDEKIQALKDLLGIE